MPLRLRHSASRRSRSAVLLAVPLALVCWLSAPSRAQTGDVENPEGTDGVAAPVNEGVLSAAGRGAARAWLIFDLMSDDPTLIADQPSGALRYALAGSSGAVMASHAAEGEPPAPEAPEAEGAELEVTGLVGGAARACAEGPPDDEAPDDEASAVEGPALPEPGGLRRGIAGVVRAVDVETAVIDYWRPPDFGQENWEWIQIKTGEWLRGEIDHMRNDELEFDSRKFKTMNINFDDVIAFYSPRINTYVVVGHKGSFSGPAQMRRGVVTVQSEDGEHIIARRDLLAILQGEPTELNRWHLQASLGLSANVGTSNQATFNARVAITRETEFNRLELSYTGNLGASRGVQTINNHYGDAAFLLLPTKRFSITLLSARLGTDRFQNLALTLTLAAGVGYKLIDIDEFTFGAGGGPAFQFTEYGSTTNVGDASNFGIGLIVSLGLEWEITGDLDFDAGSTAVLVMNNYGLSQYITNARFEYELQRNLTFDLRFDWTHLVEPVSRADGTVPERDQTTLTINLGVKL